MHGRLRVSRFGKSFVCKAGNAACNAHRSCTNAPEWPLFTSHHYMCAQYQGTCVALALPALSKHWCTLFQPTQSSVNSWTVRGKPGSAPCRRCAGRAARARSAADQHHARAPGRDRGADMRPQAKEVAAHVRDVHQGPAAREQGIRPCSARTGHEGPAAQDRASGTCGAGHRGPAARAQETARWPARPCSKETACTDPACACNACRVNSHMVLGNRLGAQAQHTQGGRPVRRPVRWPHFRHRPGAAAPNAR